jgi:hypothetical protein
MIEIVDDLSSNVEGPLVAGLGLMAAFLAKKTTHLRTLILMFHDARLLRAVSVTTRLS